MKHLFIIKIVIFMLLVTSINSLTECKTHLDCPLSACCVDGVCEKSDVCEENMNTVYVIVGLLGFGFLAISILYFIFTLRRSSRNMKNLKEKFLGNFKPTIQTDRG